MIDLSHTTISPNLSIYLPTGTNDNSWQTWQKPREFTMCSIYAIGPGGGGGAGGLNSTVAGGGGGGGSGALSRLTIPLFLLPDTLYVRVTPGSSGGRTRTTTGIGENGGIAFVASTSLVAIQPSTTTAYVLLVANQGGNGGGGPLSATAGLAGSAGSITTATFCPLSQLGSTFLIAGNAGAAGGSTGVGGSITQGTGLQIYGGAGGGCNPSAAGTNVAGGGITALASTPFIASPGGTSGGGGSPGVVGGSGSNGFAWSTIFPGKIYGGTGGGGSYLLQGGAGGNGCGPGAGGGGGGGAYSPAASPLNGRGGDGGPGCVIIQCW